MIEIWNGQSDLRHLIEAWAEEWQGESDVEQGIRDLTSMEDSEVFVLLDKDSIVGAMGIQVMDMFFVKDNYSAVRYWYILKGFRSLARDLVNYARKWSNEMACTRIMMCSNKLSLPCGDFYKAMGFKEFKPENTAYSTAPSARTPGSRAGEGRDFNR
jgi:hypothetical protein